MTTPHRIPGSERKSREQVKIEQILDHFKAEFPLDPITPYSRFFAKRSHPACGGSGLLTYLKTDESALAAELRLCSCAISRRDRFVTKALLFEAALARGGIGFAEGTVCDESELRLPANPAKVEVAQLLGAAANDAAPESATL